MFKVLPFVSVDKVKFEKCSLGKKISVRVLFSIIKEDFDGSFVDDQFGLHSNKAYQGAGVAAVAYWFRNLFSSLERSMNNSFVVLSIPKVSSSPKSFSARKCIFRKSFFSNLNLQLP